MRHIAQERIQDFIWGGGAKYYVRAHAHHERKVLTAGVQLLYIWVFYALSCYVSPIF